MEIRNPFNRNWKSVIEIRKSKMVKNEFLMPNFDYEPRISNNENQRISIENLCIIPQAKIN